MLLGSSCFDLKLPERPGAGTLQARLVYQLPGQRAFLPAAGATIELVSSSLSTRSDADGRFVLDGLKVNAGVVMVRFDLEEDGHFERQRALELKDLKAGLGRDVSLGDLLLNRNATASGTVRRGDVRTVGGHGNISVFVPELGFQTRTGDNGDWLLEELPEGLLPIAFFANGYDAQSVELSLTSGSRGVVRDIELLPAAVGGVASAVGTVSQSTGAPLQGVTVRAVSSGLEQTATSAASGEVSFTGVTPGVYSLAYELEGFETAAVLSVLLAPGENTLPPVTLLEGTSVPYVFEDLDGGTAVGCGPCSPGFTCAPSGSCRAIGCETQSCAVCSNGRCLEPQCAAGPACGPGEVCDTTACVPLECAGVSCPGGRCVAGGTCLPSQCSSGASCAPGLVCASNRCLHPLCVGKVCAAGSLCAEGSCLPTSGLLDLCGTGFVRKDGRCVEAVCQGAACAAGASCRGGTCVAEGLYAAGIIGPLGNLTNAESVLAANTGGSWSKLNVTPLPRVRQLAFSVDGAWLFAVGEDDTLRRSQDGITWQTVWSGTATSGGLMKSIAVFPNGDLYAATVGAYQTLFSQVLRSTDDGASWVTVMTPVGAFNGLPDVVSVAPPDLMSHFNGNMSAPSRGVQRFDGGVVLQGSTSPPRLIFDPNGFGPTLVAEGSLYFLDGGPSGTVSTGLGAVVYAEAPRTVMWAASVTAIWKSPDHGRSWGPRSTPTPASLDLSSLVQGVDGTLYAGNRRATPALLSSVDDGDTWLPAAPELSRVPGLSDSYDRWQPDASYGYQSRVVPTVLNGFFYEKGVGNVISTVEPPWSLDGGVTLDAQGTSWFSYPVLALRVSALASRSCSVGRLRCGAGCVDVAVDPANCGACGVACAPTSTCSRGSCQTAPQLAAVSGCADGTREGFVDLERSPALAACAGTFTGSITESGADELCSVGWHLCRHDDGQVRAVGYLAATGFPGCFAMRASTDEGCEALDCSVSNRDDVAGMGAGCAALTGLSRPPSSVTTVGGCLADRGIINSQCCAISTASPGCPQRGESGVLCCRDP